MTPLLLIDMDDTLYEERDYVISGFQYIARHLHRENPAAAHIDSDDMVQFMLTYMDTHGRGAIFNKMLDHYHIPYDPKMIKHLVNLYRNHSPAIRLYEGVYDCLEHLKVGHRLALVTDGLPLMQVNKIKALELDTIMDHLFYPWSYDAPKPNKQSYAHPVHTLGYTAKDCIIIGDNPINDGGPASAMGIPFWQIHSPRKTQADFAARVFLKFTDIAPYLDSTL